MIRRSKAFRAQIVRFLYHKSLFHHKPRRAISIEVLDRYDADILFILNYDEKPKSFFLKNPLIASLNAVKDNRVYLVEVPKWHTGGILGLNRMLDDLFKYLPENA